MNIHVTRKALMTPNQLREYNRDAQRRHRDGAETPRNYEVTESPINRPTPEMMAQASHRNAAPRSITSWVCGDPAPGQSALDKRSSSPKLESNDDYLD